MAPLTYTSALTYTQSQLIDPVNSTDALDLLLFCLGISRSEYFAADPAKELSANQYHKLLECIQRYNSHQPLAQITGTTEFRGHPVLVFPDVLIPRPETEELVSILLEKLNPVTIGTELNIMEVGTGSGCILLSLATELPELVRKIGTNTQIQINLWGVEPSPAAFQATIANMSTLALLDKDKMGINNNPNDTDWGLSGPNLSIKIVNKSIEEMTVYPDLNMLISNPPYITTAEMQELPPSVQRYEPELALNGGDAGLDVYTYICEYLLHLPHLPSIFLEASPATCTGVKELIITKLLVNEHDQGRDQIGIGNNEQNNSAYSDSVEIIPDQYGRDRFVVFNS